MDVTAFKSRGDMVSRHGIFNSSLKKYSGFTLLELLVSLAIFSTVLSLSAPSLQHFLATNRSSTHTNNLVAILALT
ncbi:MAG: prepilin-type N-terminal cleavage/methylation domain-containing protein, partial [Halobacteria archaeon]|nr:prepilin-type N-terminal cleavage/methylation domain-containing protein [Halobacteria archaeon]